VGAIAGLNGASRGEREARCLTANRGGWSRENSSPLGPERLVFFENLFTSYCIRSDFLLLSMVSEFLHQTAKRALHLCGAPEDQPSRTCLTQTRRDGFEPQQLVTRYQHGQSFHRTLAEADAQSSATGSTQLGFRDDGLHNHFIHRTASLGCSALLLSTPDRLPVQACEL
jgi:hypothetical protein